jgi:hypothetical protein
MRDRAPLHPQQSLLRTCHLHCVEDYVILDDDSDMLPEQETRHVHTSWEHGFRMKDMEKAFEILGVSLR